MESQSTAPGNVTVSISPDEQVTITTKNNGTMTAKIVALSEDQASIITASGDSIKIDEIVEVSPATKPITAKFFGGITLAGGSLATTVAGGAKPNPPLTFTYISGIRVPRK
ncbi:hypothetical protein F0169_01075 [Pseudomonas sp. MAFF 212408]|uniref:Uncharacterized protein n=1 Tax=Pseudomonas kitaguniensis TaxID=2607908 RepID=A0A5N7KF66_9PSED|nr:hypothetical protein [Pseudomonas kitaguniensis]MPR00784.1 hypothetical protein [Pseudomonas kitaguniensis]